MKIKSRLLAAGFVAIFALLASPAFADIVPCASGSLSTVQYTTCDIGNLQFYFGTLAGPNVYGEPWSAADFTFTVLSSGFALSGPVDETLTEAVSEEAQLSYTVTDLTGAIVALSVTGGDLTVSGPGYSDAGYWLTLSNFDDSQLLEAENVAYDANGTVENLAPINTPGATIFSGYGYLVPFNLFSSDGNLASTDSTTTDFMFTSVDTQQTPEPNSLLLLSIGFLGLVCATRGKFRKNFLGFQERDRSA